MGSGKVSWQSNYQETAGAETKNGDCEADMVGLLGLTAASLSLPPYASLAPIGQKVHPITLAARQPIKLPHLYRLDGAREDVLLQAVKRRTFQRLSPYCPW